MQNMHTTQFCVHIVTKLEISVNPVRSSFRFSRWQGYSNSSEGDLLLTGSRKIEYEKTGGY